MPLTDGHPEITDDQIAAVVASIIRTSGRRGRCAEILFHQEDVDIRCPNTALPSTGRCLGHSVAAYEAGTLQIADVVVFPARTVGDEL